MKRTQRSGRRGWCRVLGLLVVIVFAADADANRTHMVRPGETMADLTARYAVNAAEVRAANGLTSDQLPPGEILKIPAATEVAVTRTAEPVARQAEPVGVARAEPVAVPVADAETTALPVMADETVAEVPDPIVVEEEPPTDEPAARATGSDAWTAALQGPSGTRYNGRWRPPGEDSAWVMDCSNTARWLVRSVRGIELPRTASDQYEWLRKRKKLWRARADERSLRKRLQPGDLLFWENTYKPVRKPPITHVMVYLGTDAAGRMKMAGSQGSRGVSIYNFVPGQKMGGYRFFFFFRRDGKFVAYGRP